ncbi:MAG: hypothetical protein II192_02525, partial [Clostridia bacterium]|nr:hypothetical protein [Clostridia bacterium]
PHRGRQDVQQFDFVKDYFHRFSPFPAAPTFFFFFLVVLYFSSSSRGASNVENRPGALSP